MSKTLSAAARAEFDSEVHHAFQGVGMLMNCVTLRRNVVGDTYKFRKMGKGTANQKATQDDVTPMGVSHSLVTATLENWLAPEYTDLFDAVEVNFDEQRELAQTIANALGRRCDQIIIDTLEAATAATTAVDDDIGGSGTAMNLAKLNRANKELTDNGVPFGDRYMAILAHSLEAMLNDTTLTSADYSTVRSLVSGQVDSFASFVFKVLDDRSAEEGGLVVASSIRSNWAWHKTAVGLAIGIDIRTEVNYIPEKTSWLANGLFKAGAAVRDTAGIVEVKTNET